MERFPEHLRIASFQNLSESLHFVAADGTEIYSIEMQLILLFSKFLNFNYTIVKPPNGESCGERLKDGNWTGNYGLLQRGEADISFCLSGIFEEKTKVIDYSYPFHMSGIKFITQKPRPVQKSTAMIFYPFSDTIWITFILFILGFSLLFSAMNGREKRYVRTFFSAVGNVVEQSFDLQLTSTKHVLLFVGWIVGISFLILSYKATLLSFLLAVPTKGIKTFAELASAVADGSVKCRTQRKSYIINAFLESEIESYKTIGKALHENSQEYSLAFEYFIPDNPQRTAYVAFEDIFRVMRNRELSISEDSFLPEMLAVSMRKKFCCGKLLNKFVRRIVEGGLFEKLFEDTTFIISVMDQVDNPSRPVVERIRLTLEDLNGAFVILIIGHSLSFLVFVGEILFRKMSRQLSRNQNRILNAQK